MIDLGASLIPSILANQGLDYNVRINRLTKRFYAGENVAKGRAMYIETDNKIYHVDITDSEKVSKFVGVAEEDGIPGDIITVCTYGLSLIGGSGYSAGIVYYVGTNGFLTSIEPVLGSVVKVGVGVDSDRILILPSSGEGSFNSSGSCFDALDGGNADGSIDGGGATDVISEYIDGGSSIC